MKRPVGVLALAILSFLEGVYQVYLTLIWLGVVGFEFAGKSVRPGEAQWGQALLAGILALLYFVIAYGFWTVRVWSWIYGVFISAYNLFSLTVVVLGPVLTLESVIVPILINLLILGYLIAPGALFHAVRAPSTLMRINFATTQEAAFWKVFARLRDAVK